MRWPKHGVPCGRAGRARTPCIVRGGPGRNPGPGRAENWSEAPPIGESGRAPTKAEPRPRAGYMGQAVGRDPCDRRQVNGGYRATPLPHKI